MVFGEHDSNTIDLFFFLFLSKSLSKENLKTLIQNSSENSKFKKPLTTLNDLTKSQFLVTNSPKFCDKSCRFLSENFKRGKTTIVQSPSNSFFVSWICIKLCFFSSSEK